MRISAINFADRVYAKLPGQANSSFALAVEVAGLSYNHLINRLIEVAAERYVFKT